MATHRVNHKEKVMKDMGRLLRLLRRLEIIPLDIKLTVNDISTCVDNWKAKVFNDAAPPHTPTPRKTANKSAQSAGACYQAVVD